MHSAVPSESNAGEKKRRFLVEDGMTSRSKVINVEWIIKPTSPIQEFICVAEFCGGFRTNGRNDCHLQIQIQMVHIVESLRQWKSVFSLVVVKSASV